MPAEDGLGSDEERRPPLAWYELGQRGDDRPVRPGETGSGNLALEHGKLVAEHQDLCVLGGVVHPEDPEQFDDAADQAVEEAERHGRGASPSLSWLVKVTIE
jgi:hypothetical protein